jgi:hypothetical protein
MRGAYSAAICCCALAATVAGSAGSTTTLSTIRLRDAVSLVFPAAGRQSTRVRQVSRREVHAAIQPTNGCQPARYRAADGQSAIDSVSVRCHRNGTLEAIIRTREDVIAASHSTDAHFYLDLKVVGPAARWVGGSAAPATLAAGPTTFRSR